jgi:hypothetical protein
MMRGQLHSDTFLAVLGVALCHIDSVYTLVQLSAASRRCKAICALHATHQLKCLLLNALSNSSIWGASSGCAAQLAQMLFRRYPSV